MRTRVVALLERMLAGLWDLRSAAAFESRATRRSHRSEYPGGLPSQNKLGNGGGGVPFCLRKSPAMNPPSIVYDESRCAGIELWTQDRVA